jgi:hypothetical protein
VPPTTTLFRISLLHTHPIHRGKKKEEITSKHIGIVAAAWPTAALKKTLVDQNKREAAADSSSRQQLRNFFLLFG